MRTASFIFILLTSLFISSCSKDKGLPDTNQGEVTITQGLHGTLLFREGNCMPIIDPAVCKEYPVKRTIYIYEATTESETIPAASHSTFYSSVSTPLVATAQSGPTGFFQVELEPGKYSMFIKEDGKLWANGADNQEHIIPVTVTQGNVTQLNIVIDYKAAY